MNTIKEKNAHLWERDPLDWYVEPKECSRALFELQNFVGPIWDPACGLGNIIQQAKQSGLVAYGSDIVSRDDFCSKEFDFLGEEEIPCDFQNIVTNPPFAIAEDFIRHAIDITPTGGMVAAILPIVWLAGFSTKRSWMPVSPLFKVLPISPRPSMPPGKVIQNNIKPGNGTKDFCWLIWKVGYTCKPTVEFLNTSRARDEIRYLENNGHESTS